MRFAIVDDLGTERTLLKERLARQLRQRGTEAELLEFDSGEAFLAAEKAQRFTAAFLDIYMDGLSGMEMCIRDSLGGGDAVLGTLAGGQLVDKDSL